MTKTPDSHTIYRLHCYHNEYYIWKAVILLVGTILYCDFCLLCCRVLVSRASRGLLAFCVCMSLSVIPLSVLETMGNREENNKMEGRQRNGETERVCVSERETEQKELISSTSPLFLVSPALGFPVRTHSSLETHLKCSLHQPPAIWPVYTTPGACFDYTLNLKTPKKRERERGSLVFMNENNVGYFCSASWVSEAPQTHNLKQICIAEGERAKERPCISHSGPPFAVPAGHTIQRS